MPKAKRAAETALRLDESLAEAHAALGYVHLVYDWDGPAAEKALLRALDLNPTLASARLNYAAYLATQARHDDAVQRDPASGRPRSAVDTDARLRHACSCCSRGATMKRSNWPERVWNSNPTRVHPRVSGCGVRGAGSIQRSVANIARAAQLDNSLTILALQAHVLAVAGQKEQAEDADSAGARRRPSTDTSARTKSATVYVSLGDQDTAYRLVSQRHRRTRRLHAMAWRRALDRSDSDRIRATEAFCEI